MALEMIFHKMTQYKNDPNFVIIIIMHKNKTEISFYC